MLLSNWTKQESMQHCRLCLYEHQIHGHSLRIPFMDMANVHSLVQYLINLASNLAQNLWQWSYSDTVGLTPFHETPVSQRNILSRNFSWTHEEKQCSGLWFSLRVKCPLQDTVLKYFVSSSWYCLETLVAFESDLQVERDDCYRLGRRFIFQPQAHFSAFLAGVSQ